MRLRIDVDTGLVRRIVTQLHGEMPAPSARGILQRDTRLHVDGGSLVEARRQATDITLEAWCAQYTLTCASGSDGS